MVNVLCDDLLKGLNKFSCSLIDMLGTKVVYYLRYCDSVAHNSLSDTYCSCSVARL